MFLLPKEKKNGKWKFTGKYNHIKKSWSNYEANSNVN